MKYESPLPQEAFSQMKEDFVGLQPPISEEELADLCAGDEKLEKAFKSFLDYAIRYAQDVWSMQRFINEGKLDTEEGAAEFSQMDSARTRLHNALVDSIAILSRALGTAGKDNEWVRQLTSGTALERSACGSFALLLVYKKYIDSTGV